MLDIRSHEHLELFRFLSSGSVEKSFLSPFEGVKSELSDTCLRSSTENRNLLVRVTMHGSVICRRSMHS